MVDGETWHEAVVNDGVIMARGRAFDSPSAAAQECVGKSTNGWISWLAKRPGDYGWTPLSWLRAGRTADAD